MEKRERSTYSEFGNWQEIYQSIERIRRRLRSMMIFMSVLLLFVVSVVWSMDYDVQKRSMMIGALVMVFLLRLYRMSKCLDIREENLVTIHGKLKPRFLKSRMDDLKYIVDDLKLRGIKADVKPFLMRKVKVLYDEKSMFIIALKYK